MRYKIIEMHPADAHYPDKDRFIGKIIEPTEILYCNYNDLGKDGWKFVTGTLQGSTDVNTFLAVELKPIRKYTKKEKK